MHGIRNTARMIPEKCILIFENFRIWTTEEGRFHLKAKAADQKKNKNANFSKSILRKS
jgi:hypothetical protein